MRKTFLRYGLSSGAFIVLIFIINMVIFTGHGSVSEIAGYTAIVLSLLFVYFGMRYYRDKQNNGVLSFGQGLKVGMLITLVPAVCFGSFDLVYVRFFNPKFYENYANAQVAHLKATVPAAQFEAKAAAMREQLKFWSQPWADFLLMFTTVAIIGLIVTVISTFMLKRRVGKKQLQFA